MASRSGHREISNTAATMSTRITSKDLEYEVTSFNEDNDNDNDIVLIFDDDHHALLAIYPSFTGHFTLTAYSTTHGTTGKSGRARGRT